MRVAFCMAQKMGTRVGRGKILQRPLPKRTQKRRKTNQGIGLQAYIA